MPAASLCIARHVRRMAGARRVELRSSGHLMAVEADSSWEYIAIRSSLGSRNKDDWATELSMSSPMIAYVRGERRVRGDEIGLRWWLGGCAGDWIDGGRGRSSGSGDSGIYELIGEQNRVEQQTRQSRESWGRSEDEGVALAVERSASRCQDV